MKFSEYTVTGKQDQSIDPLGLTQPFSALRNRLYAQFTVLSNAPAYHGALALIYQVLAARKTTPEHDGFARRFREAECLWGLANVAAGQSVLNVTKYHTVLEGRDSVSLHDIGRGNAIYRSLAYGTLGHYSNPSAAWGFLDRRTVRLTPLGTRLADAFAARGRQSLRVAIERWLDGHAVTRAELEGLGEAYSLDSAPSSAEQLAWHDAVSAWCARAPATSGLWTDPPGSSELRARYVDADQYRSLFPYLADRYPRLGETFLQAGRFEIMSAVCLFLFEREYLLCHDAGTAIPAAGPLETELTAQLTQIAVDYLAHDGRQDTKKLFAELAGARDHTAATAIIVRHHVAHQKGKGALPYFEHGELRVRDRFDRRTFTELHMELNGLASAKDQLALLTYRFRRDWHFDRAQRYVRYLGGKA